MSYSDRFIFIFLSLNPLKPTSKVLPMCLLYRLSKDVLGSIVPYQDISELISFTLIKSISNSFSFSLGIIGYILSPIL